MSTDRHCFKVDSNGKELSEGKLYKIVKQHTFQDVSSFMSLCGVKTNLPDFLDLERNDGRYEFKHFNHLPIQAVFDMPLLYLGYKIIEIAYYDGGFDLSKTRVPYSKFLWDKHVAYLHNEVVSSRLFLERL